MQEIDANKRAWAKLSEDHYHHFKAALLEDKHHLNKYIEAELGDISGKRIIHLQCNTGADTILLAKAGAFALGVDLVAENILYARKLAADLNVENISFMESDIMQLMDVHHEKYDVVFVSEGAIGWLPDLKKWGETIRHLLSDDGFVYIFDSHPIFLMFDTERLPKQIIDIKYPYFNKKPDVDDSIGGYATERKEHVEAYFWMYTVSDIINALAGSGMQITYFNEYRENFYNPGGLSYVGNGLYNYPFNTDKFPMSFSLKASVAVQHTKPSDQ